MLTSYEAKEKLMLLDESIIMELLEIDTEMLLDRFHDLIDSKLEQLTPHLEEL